MSENNDNFDNLETVKKSEEDVKMCPIKYFIPDRGVIDLDVPEASWAEVKSFLNKEKIPYGSNAVGAHGGHGFSLKDDTPITCGMVITPLDKVAGA